ncbi:hypothetical protein J2Y67_004064 [Neobacillus niacini]|nr:hypothetical protein [Neobacillus niacini]
MSLPNDPHATPPHVRQVFGVVHAGGIERETRTGGYEID